MMKGLIMAAGMAIAGLGCVSGTASATTYFSDNFNGYTNGSSAMAQFGTGATVYANGDLPGWTKNSGPGNIHAVTRAAGDYAIMIYDGSLMYYGTPIAADTAGASYTVSFQGAKAVYADATQATGTGDAVEFLINDATGVVKQFYYTPTTSDFSNASFTYTGTGAAGGVYLVVRDITGDGRFGGAIDNISIADTVLAATPTSVPEPVSIALLTTGLIGAASLRRRTSRPG